MEALFVFLILIISLIVMGLIVAFSPILITTELAILTRSKNKFINTIALIAGIASPVIILVVLSMWFVDPGTKISINLPSFRHVIGTVPLLDIILGSLLIFAAIRWRFYSHNIDSVKKQSSIKRLDSPVLIYIFGFLKMLFSFSSIVIIMFSVRHIKTSIDTGTLQLLASLILVLASVMPFALVAVLHSKSPNYFDKVQQTSDRISAFDYAPVFFSAFMTLGLVLIISGLISSS